MVSPIAKNIWILGIGGPGVSVGGYGAYCLYDVSNPTGDRELTSLGYVWNPPIASSLEASSTSDHAGVIKLKTYGCFRNFFPKVEVKTDIPTDEGSKVNSDPFDNSGSSDKGEKNPVGCALMNWHAYYNQTGDSDVKKNKWIFRSEVTVKNEKTGWALWAVGGNIGAGTNGKADDLLFNSS